MQHLDPSDIIGLIETAFVLAALEAADASAPWSWLGDAVEHGEPATVHFQMARIANGWPDHVLAKWGADREMMQVARGIARGILDRTLWPRCMECREYITEGVMCQFCEREACYCD